MPLLNLQVCVILTIDEVMMDTEMMAGGGAREAPVGTPNAGTGSLTNACVSWESTENIYSG